MDLGVLMLRGYRSALIVALRIRPGPPSLLVFIFALTALRTIVIWGCTYPLSGLPISTVGYRFRHPRPQTDIIAV